MKSGKRRITDGMELPNQDKMRTLETYKYLGILEADTINQVEMKDKIQKEYLRRTKFRKNISGELENYLRHNSLTETSSKE